MRFVYIGMVIIMIFGADDLAADVPDWVRNSGSSSSFPEYDYFTGFGLAEIAGDIHGAFQSSKRMAQADLLEKVHVLIQSYHEQSVVIDGTGSGILKREYVSKISISGQMQITGIHTRFFHDNVEQKVYAFSWLHKLDMMNRYEQLYQKEIMALKVVLHETERSLHDDNRLRTRLHVFEGEQIVSRIEKSKAVMSACGFKKRSILPDSALVSRLKGYSRIIWGYSAGTIDELGLKLCRDAWPFISGKKVFVGPFTHSFENGCTQFGLRIKHAILNQITTIEGILPVVDELWSSGTEAVFRSAKQADADYILTGKYYMHDSLVTCLMNVVEAKNMSVIVTMKGTVCRSLLGSEIFLKSACHDTLNGALRLEAWTSRGSRGIVVEEGDEVAIVVKVNKPCYLRYIHTLASGERIIPDILYENYFIDDTKVNKHLILPDIFIIKPPLGRESMEIFVSERPFGQLEIKTQMIHNEMYKVVADISFSGDMSTTVRGIGKKGGQARNAYRKIDLITVRKSQ